MKTTILLSLFFSFLSVLQADERNVEVAPPQESAVTRIHPLDKGSQLIGVEVWNPEGQRLGTIKDLMLNLHQERIVYAVLGTGGFLGIGDKLVALPPNALNVSLGQKHLILHADQESLKAAPSFEKNNWPEMANTQWISEGQGHYAKQTSKDINEAAGAEKKSDKTKEKPNTSGKPDQTPPKTLRASELIGTTINNLQSEKLGEVEDVVVNLKNGKILYVVLSTGGQINNEQKRLAIAPTHFQSSEESKTLVLDVSKDVLASTAGFGSDDWPTGPDKHFPARKINEPAGSLRPSENDGRTALDQSNSRRDLMITQQLRRAIMRDDTMSTLTRNITIITADGRITVRGRVASQLEVDRIVAFAREIAGDEVTNELQVQNEGKDN